VSAMKTVGDVVSWWLSRIENDNTRSESYRKSMASLMRKHVIPRAGKMLLKKVNKVSIDDSLIFPLHQTLKPRTIQKVLQGLRQAFRMAEDLGRIKDNPLKGTTFKDFYKGKLRPKPAAFSRVDLAWLVALLVENFNADPVKGMLPLMMLAHGTRIAESLKAEWVHISLDERIWIIPESNNKSRRQHPLPLTPQIVALLGRYRAALPDPRLKATWVFSVRGGSRMANTSAHALFRKVSGRQWSSHDLRKLMRSSLTDIGIDHHVAEILLNHTLGATAETYLTRDLMDRMRDAMERWHARLDELGFAEAHGAKVALPALLSNRARPYSAGDSA